MPEPPTVQRGSGSPPQEFRTCYPWENLYLDDLVSITESLEELQEKLADPLEDQHGSKKTSGQQGQNQGTDIWAGAGCASDV